MLRKLQAICSGVSDEVGEGVAPPAVGVPIVVGGFVTGCGAPGAAVAPAGGPVVPASGIPLFGGGGHGMSGGRGKCVDTRKILTRIVDSLLASSFDRIAFTSFLASLTGVATGACALLRLLFAVARFQSPLSRVAAVPLARFTIITTINLGFICVSVCFQLSFADACRKASVGGCC